MSRRLPKATAVFLTISFLWTLGGVSPSVQAQANEPKPDTYRLLELFGEVFERVRSDYVEQVSDEQLIEAAIEGMLTHLDPHSAYLNKNKFRDMQVQTKGEFGGLGIEVTMEKGYVKVVSPIDETPASRAGLQAGDLITHLDNEPVQGLSLPEAVEKMRGPVNTKITLTVQRGSARTFEVTLTRDRIRIQSVRSRIEGNIGYLRVTSFSEQTDSGLKRAVERIKDKLGGDLAGYVLDLRNNPGGLLDQAVTVADSFLDQGEIVSTRGRDQEVGQRFNASSGDLADGKPIVVLINGGSASASEIVAGALQDHRRAILLGTKTFGKGSVQTIIPLGRNGAMKLTTQRYYTPSGRSIQAKGIEPDIEVKQARIEPLEAVAPERSERDLRRALENDIKDEKKAPDESGAKQPDEQSETTVEQEAEQQDYQLERAFDLLRGLAAFYSRMVN